MASEDKATSGQIGHLYAVIKGLKINYKEFEKAHNIKLYGPTNKPTRGQVSKWIEELEAIEAEQKAASMQPATNREEAEAQRIREEQGRAPVATTIPMPAAEAVRLAPVIVTDSEKVDYYISLIGEITKKVEVEERIPTGERGYAISKVFDAITRDRRSELIAELKNGGNSEEA